MLAVFPPNKCDLAPRDPLSTEKGRRLARNCTGRKAQFSERLNPWDESESKQSLEFCACKPQLQRKQLSAAFR